MLRKASIVVVIALIALTAACGPKSSSAAGGGTTATAVAAGGSACPTHNTEAFAKTRFVLDAALAAGAFKHYIYTPWQQGAFKKGAPHRVSAMVKAAVAGAFVINRLLAAEKAVKSSPLLCNAILVPMEKFKSALGGLVTKARGGNLGGSDVSNAKTQLESFRSAAGGSGALFQDASVVVPGA